MHKHAAIDTEIFEPDAEAAPAPSIKRGRGRPLGSKGKTTQKSRSFTVSDFSFLRAVIQGMHIKSAAQRYLLNLNSSDEAAARALSKSLYERILRAGRATWAEMPESGNDELARKIATGEALRIIEHHISAGKNVIKAAPVKTSIPTLDEFVAAEGLDPDFYSESELVELYTEKWGQALAAEAESGTGAATTGTGPSVADITRALGTLQSLISIAPSHTDPVATWVNTRFSEQVRMHGVLNIGELARWVNENGRSWYKRLPGVGKTKARRITQWLLNNEQYTQVKIDPLIERIYMADSDSTLPPISVVTEATSTQSYALAPLEELSWPVALLGENGQYRSPATNTFSARNDMEAVRAWFHGLSTKSESTKLAYKRSIERLILWALLERKCALSSLSTLDLQAFRTFLENPPDSWLLKTPVLKGSQLWRPLRKPLGEKSLAMNMQAVMKMYAAWFHARYLEVDPCKTLERRKRTEIALDVTRTLTMQDLSWIKSTIAEMKPGPAKNRLIAMLQTLLNTGLRADELVGLKWKDVKQAQVDLETTDTYVITVIGKGNKERIIPLKHEAYCALRQHRQDRIALTGTLLSDFSRFDAGDWPLVGIIDQTTAQDRVGRGSDYSFDCARESNKDATISYERLKKILKDFWLQCAKNAEKSGQDGSRLKKATPHWCRHTFAHLALKATGKDIAVVQTLLGHSDIKTTAIYIKADLSERIDGIEKIPQLL